MSLSIGGLFKKNSAPVYSEDVISTLRLIRSENVGPMTFFALIKMFKTSTAALDNIQTFAKRGGKNKPITVYSREDALSEIDNLNAIGAKLITYNDSHFSKLLRYIADCPPIISYLGNIELLNANAIAIVGARNASVNGRVFASRIAEQLVKQGLVVVSGLARGIDTAAHSAAFPKTIAVVAGGIDYIYPPENKELFQKIAERGLVIAELPVGEKPLGRHFPQRNRIISGLSLGSIVVEASLKSGSLITARFAAEHNREVFAVPGFPLDPRAQGTNHLIKEGAHLLESIDDIFDNIQISSEFFHEVEELENLNDVEFNQGVLNDEMRNKILECLSSTPISINQIIQFTSLPLPLIYTAVLEFELAGKVIRSNTNKISRNYSL